MAQTRAFQRLGTKFWDQIPMPGCEETDLWSDEYWACMSRHYTTTIYHHSGAAKMGPASDPQSVVNHELKVYGIPRLRVIDASIMPTIVSGNTNAPTIMIAEKGSDMIKADWGFSGYRSHAGLKKRRRRKREGSKWDGKQPDGRKRRALLEQNWPTKANLTL